MWFFFFIFKNYILLEKKRRYFSGVEVRKGELRKKLCFPLKEQPNHRQGTKNI